VAEGIEDSETLAMVRAFEIDYAQGFHIGEPALVESAPIVATA
jgi:EAL domain-containing protein (putative c-di-GMP-specific phosphodiesterase class I)